MHPTLEQGAWNYSLLWEEWLTRNREKYAGKSAEELILIITALHAVISPFRVALQPVLDKSWRGTTVSSKLFPLRPEGEESKFYVFNQTTRKSDSVVLTEEQLTETAYYTEDGLTIEDGSRLGDGFELLSFHQAAPGAYIGNGSLTVGEVRILRLLADYYGEEDKLFTMKSNEEPNGFPTESI